MMNSKAILNQVKNKILPGRRALTECSPFQSFPCLCTHCVSMYTYMYLCSNTHVCMYGCLCMFMYVYVYMYFWVLDCECFLGLCPSKTSFA